MSEVRILPMLPTDYDAVRALWLTIDGFGIRAETEGNAIKAAKTPHLTKYFTECPFTTIGASGLDVGLPDGQMGNSEVGHTNIGAGRVVYQMLVKITKDIQDGVFFENKALLAAIDEGRLMGAGLDCVEDDPLPAGHPLLNHPNIVITPHVGGNTSDLATVMVPMIVDNLKKFLHGEKPRFIVNEKELAK